MKSPLMAFVLIVGGLAFVRPDGQRADPPDDPQAVVSGDATSGQPNVEVLLAEAKLELAQFELRRAKQTNRQTQGTFRRTALDRLEQAVKISKIRLEFAKGKEHDLHAVHLLQLEGDVELAKRQLKAAKLANRRTPGAVPEMSLDRMRLQAEVTRLSLIRARESSNFESPEAHLQWQLDRLHEEIHHLRSQLELLALHE